LKRLLHSTKEAKQQFFGNSNECPETDLAAWLEASQQNLVDNSIRGDHDKEKE